MITVNLKKSVQGFIKAGKGFTQVLTMITDDQRRKQNANTRKEFIIAKLATEFYRPSPFELTDNLVRTKKKWEKLNAKAKESLRKGKLSTPEKSLIQIKHEQESDANESMIIKIRSGCRCQSGVSPPENSMVSTTTSRETSHQNNFTSTVTSPTTDSANMNQSTNSEVDINKPALIVTNVHKLISADSKVKISFPPTLPLSMSTNTVTEEWFSCIPSVSVFSTPPKLSVIEDHVIDQTLKFTITNGSNEYVHLKYIEVTDKAYFCYAKVCPNYSHKVYPGMSVKYKLFFKLKMRKIIFSSTLFFRVTCNRIYDRPSEGFNVPITSDYFKTRAVDVSEVVRITPIYSWHFKKNKEDPYPTGIIEVSVNDGYSYHLYINRRPVDYSQLEEDNLSGLSPVNFEKLEMEDMAIMTDSLIKRVLDSFLIDKSYMLVKSSSKKYKIPVYLHIIERIGCHNCYYDLTFYDAYTDEFIFRKTTRIFADILPSPIEISPPMLDMSHVPIYYSFGESVFYITNNHKLFPVLIKIVLSKNMKRMFRVIPMEIVIPTTTTVQYQIKFCTLDTIRSAATDKVYIAFEIAMFGPKFIYKDMPHIYYEVVAPCLQYYRQITHRVDDLLPDLGTT